MLSIIYFFDLQMRCTVRGCRYDASPRDVQRHIEDHHHQHSLRGNGRRNVLNVHPFIEKSAFRGFLRTYRHRIDESQITSIYTYFQQYYKQIRKIFTIVKQRNRRSIKTQITLAVTFSRGDDGDYEEISRYENSKLKILHSMLDFDEMLSYTICEIVNYVEMFESFGSGWQLQKINGCDIRIGLLPHIAGGCLIEMQPWLKNKHCMVNVQNLDNECFKWAFLSIMHYKEIKAHRYRVSKYRKFENLYDFSGMNFPAGMVDVATFNKKNYDKKICVNVFTIDDRNEANEILPLKLSSDSMNPEFKKINLLLYDDGITCNQHYLGICNMSSLFGKSGRTRHEFCYNCCNMITTKSWKKHSQMCSKMNMQSVSIPENEFKNSKEYESKSFTQFDQIKKLCAHEYAIFADFEAICVPQNFSKNDNLQKLSEHVPCGYAYAVLNGNKLASKKVYRGEDCIDHFFTAIGSEVKRIKDIYDGGILMRPLSDIEYEHYMQTDECHICQQEIEDENEKVRDHNPFTGEFRGPAHMECNSQYTLKKSKIPVVLHGFRNYDSHLIIKGFAKYGKRISVIPSNSEKYISIMCDDFIFLDSTLFLNASLSTLVENLKTFTDESNVVDEYEAKFNPLIEAFGFEKAVALSRKGVYPYDYMTSFKKFEETKLPQKEKFFNSLTQENASDQDYEYASTIFQAYCKNMGDYHDLYLLTDALLLGIVFQYFGKVTITHYRLDPLHYFSLSQYSLDAALLMSNARLEKLTDLDMYTFFEAALRGGISTIATREAIARNHHLKNCEDPNDSKYLCYLDKVNLYGEAFLHKTPVRDFRWLSDEKVQKLTKADILDWDPDGHIGYTLMVDLDYPPSIHWRDNDLPLAPEKIAIPRQNLSKQQKMCLKKQNIKYSDKIKKLIPHLGSRKEYVVHYRNLQFYLKMGMKLTKIHRVVRYVQEAWMRDYVLFNANMRKNSKNTFEKNLFKFFVNAVFGKTIEQVRSRRRIVIANTHDQVMRYIKSPLVKTFDILEENLAIFELYSGIVYLNKPVYVGVTILDLSKLFLYEFHYKFKEYFNEEVKLLFTDTDSLAYEVKTDDIFKDFENFKDIMDFSDYPKDHFLYSEKNKKKIGCMKDEGNSKIFSHFIGLAPKLYSFIGKDINKNAVKGVNKAYVKKKLRHELFQQSLHNQRSVRADVTSIRSFKHKLYTIRQKKVGLRCFDSKKYILPSGVNTLSFNHFLLKPLKRCN